MNGTKEKLVRCKKRGVPIVAIETANQPDVINSVGKLFDDPVYSWNLLEGVSAKNKPAGEKAVGECRGSLVAAVQAFMDLPGDAILIVQTGDRYFSGNEARQHVNCLLNARDRLKSEGRMLVLLGDRFSLPIELQADVIVMRDSLPSEDAIAEILRETAKNAEVELEEGDSFYQCVHALRGLSEFAVEQIAALELTPGGYSPKDIWSHKESVINQTPGLNIIKSNESMQSLKGLDYLKGFIQAVLGNGAANAIVFIDEIEKAMAGQGDTSGVSQDQLGVILSYMQDHGAKGIILVGPPGSGKSAIAKAAGGQHGLPTLSLDLGGVKGGLVGQSEGQIRKALDVVSAISDDKTLWIATSNNIQNMPPELRRRFSLGTYFVDVPDEDAIEEIWSVYASQYGLKPESFDYAGWTGAEVKQCCEIASLTGMSLRDAAGFIVPVSVSAKSQIESLRESMSGRCLNATNGGLFKVETDYEKKKRKLKIKN